MSATMKLLKESPKNFALLATRLQISYLLLHLRNKVLQGEYECLAVYDIALSKPRFSVADNMLRDEIGLGIKALDQGGFPNLWEQELINFMKLKAMEWPRMKEASSLLSMNMLWPLEHVSSKL